MIPTKSNNCDQPSSGMSTSSNLVIWQGPNISCINLCKGDTVSDVVYKLAQEVCSLQGDLGISDVDFKCLVEGAGNPTTLAAALQLLIDKTCSLDQLIGDGSDPAAVEEKVLAIAQCFRTNDSSGNPITQLPHSEYTLQMGIKICDLVSTVGQHTTTLGQYGARITALEQKPAATYTPPTVTPSCILPASATQMNTVLGELEKQFCELRSATGTPTKLSQAFAKQCAGLGQEPALSGSGNLGSVPGWVTNVTSAADTLNNLWLTVCDMRTSLKAMLSTFYSTICNQFTLEFTGIMNQSRTGIVLFFYPSTVVPSGFYDCNNGAKITIKDAAGNVYTTFTSIVSASLLSTGVEIDLQNTPVSLTLDYTVTVEACITNGVTQCSKTGSKTVTNAAACPNLTLQRTTGTLAYSFADNSGGKATYTLELLDNNNLVVKTQTIVNPAAFVTGSFTSLNDGLSYKVRLTTTTDGVSKVCPVQTVTGCLSPTNASATMS